MVHFCDGLFGLISMAGAGPSVLKFEYGWAGLGLGWAGAGAPYSNLSTVELGLGWAGATAPYSNLSTVELGLGWAGAELGFGLNGLHIESCFVCFAFMVDY